MSKQEHVNFALDSTDQLFAVRGSPVIVVCQGTQNPEENFDWATLRQINRVVVFGLNGIEVRYLGTIFWRNAMTFHPAKTRIVFLRDVFCGNRIKTLD